MKKIQRTGVIREYDMHSPSVKIGYGFLSLLCMIMVVLAIFPLVWVVLLGAGGTGSQGGWWSWCFPARGFSPSLRCIFQPSTQFGS